MDNESNDVQFWKQREMMQQRTFFRWMNTHLNKRLLKVEELEDLSSGTLLIALLEILSEKALRQNKQPKLRIQRIENCQIAVQFMKDQGINTRYCSSEDIVDANQRWVLGTIWMIIAHYQVKKGRTDESLQDALREWVKSKLPDKLEYIDFAYYWQNGTALCELIEVLKPGTIPNAKQLSCTTALDNATLAIDKAESELGIPKIIVPEDLVADVHELAVVTYLSYFRDYDEQNSIRKPAVSETSGTTASVKSIAYGPGLETGLANSAAQFMIEARDVDGQRLTHGGDLFRVNVVNGSEQLAVDVVDEGNGLYNVRYTPSPGKYTVTVQLGDAPISGSPWLFDRTWYTLE